MKVKTADLLGRPLRYAVAVCEGLNVGILTVEEQWERFIEGASSEDLDKHAEGYAAIKAGLKTEICNVHGDGFKSTLDAQAWRFDEDWGVGGPMLDREEITIDYRDNETQARKWSNKKNAFTTASAGKKQGLIAAMRCLVASRLGDEVDVPDELVNQHEE